MDYKNQFVGHISSASILSDSHSLPQHTLEFSAIGYDAEANEYEIEVKTTDLRLIAEHPSKILVTLEPLEGEGW